MKKYKVIVIKHQLKNQVVAKCGDIVDGSQLNNNADELVKKGFIELVKDDSTKEDLENTEAQAEKDRLAKEVAEKELLEKDKSATEASKNEDSKQLELVEEKEVKTETKVSKK